MAKDMKKENDKYLVIKREDLDGYFGYGLFERPKWVRTFEKQLEDMLKDINGHRRNPNKYIVCNQDEPYAEEVWNVILEGERKKRSVSNDD